MVRSIVAQEVPEVGHHSSGKAGKKQSNWRKVQARPDWPGHGLAGNQSNFPVEIHDVKLRRTVTPILQATKLPYHLLCSSLPRPGTATPVSESGAHGCSPATRRTAA